MSYKTVRKVAALSLFFVLGLARAQDGEPQEADPPDRAARLSLIRGDVVMQPAGAAEEEWVPAVLNRPLTTGDKLWTERGARAEIQVGQAAVRLAENTGFSFLNVDDDTIQMRMTAGVLNVSVRALANEEIEIDTPNLAVSLVRAGSYRIEVNDTGDTTVVKVNEGEAEASGPSRNDVVHAGEIATFSGTERLVADFGKLGAPDEFDTWSLDRDRGNDRVASSPTAEYVSPDVTGYEDLDANGSWSSEPEYGNVWTPRAVAVDWAPYRFGRWVWISPWGWSWIDDAPWGYAPFHYGRWARVRERWCWVPGPRHVRSVYAPALVGWVGPPGVNVTIVSGGRVGWFPLGPREVYVPARRFSPRYVERVNVTNTLVERVRIHEAYEHRARNIQYRNRGAVTVVNRSTFTTATRVGNNRVRVNDREIERTLVTERAPRIEPVRESRLGGAPRASVRPPQTIVNRQVVVRRNPPPASVHLARNPGNQLVTSRPSADRGRPQNGDAPDQTARMRDGRDRDRQQRPQPADRPAEMAPRVQPSVSEQHTPVERPREDRVRSDRPQREHLERQQQNRDRQQQREQQQASDRQRQQQERERVQGQQDAQRQAAARQMEQQRERRSEAPRAEHHEQPQNRPEQRREERPAQSPQRSQSPQPPDKRTPDSPRHNRN